MAWEGKLNRIDSNRWEIPMDESAGMRTNAVIYASEEMIGQVCSDNAPQQAANVACIPGIVGSSMAMPDIHWGYGFPIGGVAAVDADSGSISPGGIGFDINCGVRTIKTDLTLDDVKGKMYALMDSLYANVPSGLGSKGLTRVGQKELTDILENGSRWAVENGKVVNVLLELHLGAEETKHGLSEEEIREILSSAESYGGVRFCGLMGMATNTDDQTLIRADFSRISCLRSDLQAEFPGLKEFRELSIGMSEDWRLALEYGATIIRVGTAIFGPREY